MIIMILWRPLFLFLCLPGSFQSIPLHCKFCTLSWCVFLFLYSRNILHKIKSRATLNWPFTSLTKSFRIIVAEHSIISSRHSSVTFRCLICFISPLAFLVQFGPSAAPVGRLSHEHTCARVFLQLLQLLHVKQSASTITSISKTFLSTLGCTR